MGRITLPILLLCLFVAPLLQAQPFQLNDHYFKVFRERPPADPERVQVESFFWYACPHCYQLEPYLHGWQRRMPDFVDYRQVPAMFERPNVIMHAKTFYALQMMGVDEAIHAAIFDAMHKQNLRLNTQPEMEEVLQREGVDLEAYRNAMRSFAINVQANQARELANDYEISGVPTLVIGGKYRARNLEGPRMMELLNYLVDKVKREQKGG